MTTTIPPAVDRGRALVTPALRAAVARLHPRLAQVVGYHRGWVDQQGNPRSAGGGKALRPALALLSAEAARAPVGVGLPGAVAVELVHDFSLLHDDLMDGDTERRHRPTAWAAFGAGSAILAGDALLGLATQVLLDVEGPAGPRAARMLGDAVQQLVLGQTQDLFFETRTDVGIQECLAMAAGKTGALLSCAAAVGAILAGGRPPLVDGLASFGARLGLAFQLVDDLLGIWGEPEVTGKPVLSDLRSRKKSVPVVVALSSGGPQAGELRRFLGSTHTPTEDELRAAADLVEGAGGRAWTAGQADRELADCERALDGLDLPPAVAAELRAIARFVGERDR